MRKRKLVAIVKARKRINPICCYFFFVVWFRSTIEKAKNKIYQIEDINGVIGFYHKILKRMLSQNFYNIGI
jgi:hypothetical protein